MINETWNAFWRKAEFCFSVLKKEKQTLLIPKVRYIVCTGFWNSLRLIKRNQIPALIIGTRENLDA